MPDNPFPFQVDASIPLSGSMTAKAPAPPPPVGGLEALGSIADTMGKMNQLRLFQQTFHAKQKMGQILSTAPDTESGWETIMRDPEVAPFAGEALGQWRAAQLAFTQQQGEQQKQAQDAYRGFVLSLPRLLQDPGQWNSAVTGALATTPEAVRGRVSDSMEALRAGLLDHLPSDPVAARRELNKRISAALVTLPGGLDSIKGVLGTPETKDTGGALVPGVVAPPQGGISGEAPGQFTGTPPVVKKTLAPQVLPGTPAIIGGAHGTGGGGEAPEGADEPVTLGMAGNGKPLTYDPRVDGRSPKVGSGAAGLNVLSPAQEKASEELMKVWTTDGARAASNAQTTMALLEEMDHDFDVMQRNGGFNIPGAAAKLRATISTYANTLAQMTPDKKPPFDPAKIAAIENLTKDTKRLGLSVLTTMLGNQREAAETINNITAAVPNIENTYLGGKLLIASIRAATQRAIDQRQFENAWQQDPKNQGSLLGADVAFNKKFPATEYASKVLDEFGLDRTGFKSPPDVIAARNKGWLTQKQAQTIMEKEGWIPTKK